MAIACTEPVAEIVSTSNASTYDFASFTPTASALLVVIAMVRGSVGVGTMVNVSGTSLTWTRKTAFAWNAGADTMYVHWAKVPASTVASVYRVDTGADGGTGCIAYMYQFTGHDAVTSDPIKQIATNAAATANPVATFATALNTNNGYCAGWEGALSSANPANVSAPPVSWTEVGDNGFATPTTNGSGAFRAGGETGTTVTFTAGATTYGIIAVEVYVDGAGPRKSLVFEEKRNRRNYLLRR